MRRITLFYAVLVMFMVSVQALAQQSGCLDELRLKSISIKGEAPAMVPNTWYLLFNKHMAQSDGGYAYDKATGEQLYKSYNTAVSEGDNARDKACYMVRFIEGEGQNPDQPAYYIQFGDGNYIANGGSHDGPISVESKDDAVMWNIGLIEETPGHFWLCEDSEDLTGNRMDNQGTNAHIVYWEQGITNPEYDSDHLLLDHNYDWQLIDLELTDQDERAVVLATVQSRYEELIEYYDSFVTGAAYGQYPEDKVQAFQTALDDVNETLDDASKELTLEDLNAMLNRMNDTYSDLLKSQNKPASGYYFVKSGAGDHFWYETTTTPDTEDPVTGETIPGTTETKYLQKAMYCSPLESGWKTFYPDSADASFLFRIDVDDETGNLQFSSAATGGRIPEISTSTKIVFDSTLDPVESEVKFYFSEPDSVGNVTFAIRRANQSGDYQFIHQGGHSSGKGKKGTLVGWVQDADASRWALLPVAEEKALQLLEDYSPARKHAKMVQEYDSIKSLVRNEMAIAKEMTNLVTDASQFSSPWTEPYEGTIEAMLDGDYSTYWHSCWSAGSVEMDVHYLQVALPEPITGSIKMTFVRRNAWSDQVTDFILKASELDSEDDDDWTELGHFLFPELVAGKLMTSEPIEFEGSYQYIRVYPHVTEPLSEGGASGRGYWHAAELNFLPGAASDKSQAVVMGELYTNLEQVLDEQADVTSATLTEEMFNKLKQVVDAFHTKYVDPAELRSAIATAKSKIKYVVEGDEPGYWSDMTAKTSLETLLTDANAYYDSRDFTPAQSTAYVKQLLEGADAVLAGANQVRIDKWYRIQFPSEEMYDDYGWSKSGAELGQNESGVVYADALFDKYVALGKLVQGDGSSTNKSYQFPEMISADEAYQGAVLVAANEEQLSDDELTMFRFVAIGDSAYMIQNKATGLYLRLNGVTSANSIADIHPTLFKVQAIGAGVNVFKAEEIDGTDYSYMHIQHSGSKVVSWNASTLGCNSCFLIHEAGDITDLPGNEFVKGVEEGKVYPMCYGCSFAVTGAGAQIYTVKGINVEGDTYSVVLTPTEEAAAGQPVILIADGEYETLGKNEEPDYVEVAMKHGTKYVAEPTEANCIRGTFVYTSIGKGYIVANEGGFIGTTKKSNDVEQSSAYLVYENGSVEIGEDDLAIEVGNSGKIVDSIDKAISNVSASGTVYSIDGRLLLENGNINSVRQFGKGMYIVNGVKVLVK